MSLLNYGTKIEPEQTIAEIQKLLSNHGVSAMMTEYDGPHVASVSFRINLKGSQMSFRLPCNWRSVLEILKADPAARRRGAGNEKQAIRVAWRIILSWMKAQIALVEVGMVTIPQIFLPYTVMRDDRTLAEHIESNPSLLLGPGNSN